MKDVYVGGSVLVLLGSEGRRMQLASYGKKTPYGVARGSTLGEYPEFSERWQGGDVQRTECVRVSGS